MEKWSKFKKLFLEHFLPHDHIQKMKKRLKNLRQGTLLVRKYKDRFDGLVEYFSDFSNQKKNLKKIKIITGPQNSIKYDVKALKPYTLGKTYSMALTFGTKNVELAKEKKFSFDVSYKDHSSERKIGRWRRSQQI